MVKGFLENQPSISMNVVGFGQAGSRIADQFASFKDKQGNSVYNCFALNTNTGDLTGLKHIPSNHRFDLDLGGLGKNAEKGLQKLKGNKDFEIFMREKLPYDSDLLLFVAGLGGGTGTSTIIKAVEEYSNYIYKPAIKRYIQKLADTMDPETFKNNLKKITKKATMAVKEELPSIGIIVTLPLKSEGADTIRQASKFADELWKQANSGTSGISFIVFADNQFFMDEFKRLPENQKMDTTNYRDYANKIISKTFHEINTASNGEGSDVIFDQEDFKRIVLEGQGSLVINRLSKPIEKIQNSSDIENMFLESIKGSVFHEPIQLVQKDEDGELELTEIYHIGLMAVIDKTKEISSDFMDETKVKISGSSNLYITGSLFTGYLQEKNDFEATVYTFFKCNGLPSRLVRGLVAEWEEYQARKKSVKTMDTSIQTIQEEDTGFDLDIDLDLLGLNDELESNNEEDKQKDKKEIQKMLDDINIDELLK